MTCVMSRAEHISTSDCQVCAGSKAGLTSHACLSVLMHADPLTSCTASCPSSLRCVLEIKDNIQPVPATRQSKDVTAGHSLFRES